MSMDVGLSMERLQSLLPALTKMSSPSASHFWEDHPTTRTRMELILNRALCIIHNLSKSTKHREQFRTPEMRKVLDVYKGSPSAERRTYSLLAIGYMADPTIDMLLLEDKFGAISDLTDYLVKSLVPGNSTGFSVQELIEGLENLAVHPINKDQIIDKSLHLFYTILEGSFDEKLKSYVREVLDTWGFSDVGCPATSSNQCQGEKGTDNKGEQQSSEAQDVADDVQMLDNLQCVLRECDSFNTDEVPVMETVAAIVFKQADRQTILKHMTDHEWPDLLVRIISDVWLSSKDVYTDEATWAILLNTINVFVIYSDAGIEFADVLMENGALEIMHKIAYAYHLHLDQKINDLLEKISVYRGEDVPSEKPQTDINQPMDNSKSKDVLLKPETTDRHTATSTHHSNANDDDKSIGISKSKNSQGIKPSESPSYTLKPVSQFGCVEDGGTVAYRKDIHFMSNRAVFVSNEPVQTSILFELKIDKTAERHSNSLELGVCMYNEFPNDIIYLGSGYGQGSGFWFLSKNELWKDFAKIGGGYELNLHNMHINDRVGFVRHPDGTMGFLYNGQYQGLAFRDIPEGVYVLVATTGNCVQVSITDGSGTYIKQEKETPDNVPTEPYDSFSIRTVGSESVSISRKRTPYGQDFADTKDIIPETKKTYKNIDGAFRNMFVEADLSLNPLFEMHQRSSEKGYINEIDMMTTLKSTVSLYNIHREIMFCDPVSKYPMRFITMNVQMFGDMLSVFQRNSVPPESTSTLPKRLKEIFEAVRPCFDNIQDMSGIVWTGSTSEGVAIADNSGPGTTYVDDEMDLMIPLAMAAEDTRKKNTFDDDDDDDDAAILHKKTLSKRGCELKVKGDETGDFKKESLVTELERLGKLQQSEEYPSFIWRPSNNPGYVSIVIPESMQPSLSDGFIKHVCTQSTSSDGRNDLLLTRSKLLAIQEEYTRGRLAVVQSKLAGRHDEEGDFKGQLRLVQEGPVQTISVRYQVQESGGSVLEFDQTVDVAIALKGIDWPVMATPWISRTRHWPDQNIVDKIISDGYHIVPKYYPGGSGVDIEWRLSFSVAERTLAHTYTDVQRKCYLVFKKLWRKYLKVPKVLSSYHLKTTMFWLCEKTRPTDWQESDMGERFLELQNSLINFLQRKNVPNFFIPENNMISHVDPADVKVLLEKVQDVRRRQKHYLEDLVTATNSLHIS